MSVQSVLAAIGPAPRRHTIRHYQSVIGHRTEYGPWTIYFDPPPIPVRNCDWHYVHKDFDGAPDANDNRCGSCASFADALTECDDMEEDALLAQRERDGGE